MFFQNNAQDAHNAANGDPITAIGAMAELTALFYNQLLRHGIRRKDALELTETMYVWTFHGGGVMQKGDEDAETDEQAAEKRRWIVLRLFFELKNRAERRRKGFRAVQTTCPRLKGRAGFGKKAIRRDRGGTCALVLHCFCVGPLVAAWRVFSFSEYRNTEKAKKRVYGPQNAPKRNAEKAGGKAPRRA